MCSRSIHNEHLDWRNLCGSLPLDKSRAWAYPPLELSHGVFPSPPAETTVKLRLQLIKTKALELIDNLKV